MKAFIASLACALVLAVGAAYTLELNWQRPAYDAYSTSSVRVGEPGHNLVGGGVRH